MVNNFEGDEKQYLRLLISAFTPTSLARLLPAWEGGCTDIHIKTGTIISPGKMPTTRNQR